LALHWSVPSSPTTQLRGLPYGRLLILFNLIFGPKAKTEIDTLRLKSNTDHDF
jgi:hypothetical protein